MNKENILFILVLVLIGWNVYLSLPKKDEGSQINYELLQHVYKQQEQRMEKFWHDKITKFKPQYEKDSIFVHSASRSERDSLRSELNSPY